MKIAVVVERAGREKASFGYTPAPRNAPPRDLSLRLKDSRLRAVDDRR